MQEVQILLLTYKRKKEEESEEEYHYVDVEQAWFADSQKDSSKKQKDSDSQKDSQESESGWRRYTAEGMRALAAQRAPDLRGRPQQPMALLPRPKPRFRRAPAACSPYRIPRKQQQPENIRIRSSYTVTA